MIDIMLRLASFLSKLYIICCRLLLRLCNPESITSFFSANAIFVVGLVYFECKVSVSEHGLQTFLNVLSTFTRSRH